MLKTLSVCFLTAVVSATAALAARPTITAVTPDSGPNGGGTTVAITGSNFMSGATVNFGGVGATVLTIAPTEIDVLTPPHAPGIVSVQVKNPGTGPKQATRKNAYTYICAAPPCQLAPLSLNVDPTGGSSVTSDNNGVLEPGETATVVPTWTNSSGMTASATGVASSASGPAGMTYTLSDTSAAYPSTAAGAAMTATANPYAVTVDNPATRPATHVDMTFSEAVVSNPPTGTAPTTWTVHIGNSFSDVSRTNVFYTMIETILHNGVTTGCDPTAGLFCPSDAANRSQMAAFISRALLDGDANVPDTGTVGSNTYNCTSGGNSLFVDVQPTDLFCRHIHYIYSQNVTLGCSPSTQQYCQATATPREQMAAFIARAIVAPQGDAGVPSSVALDPNTGLNIYGQARSYDCADDSTLFFSDVKSNNGFCKQIYFLWARGVVNGFADGTYGPGLSVTREQMSKFLTNGFALKLY